MGLDYPPEDQVTVLGDTALSLITKRHNDVLSNARSVNDSGKLTNVIQIFLSHRYPRLSRLWCIPVASDLSLM